MATALCNLRDDWRDHTVWLWEIPSGGPVPHAEILIAGRRKGYTRDKVRRAKERMGAKSCRQGFGPRSRAYWELKHRCTSPGTDTIGGT